jgi:hypothetical protein
LLNICVRQTLFHFVISYSWLPNVCFRQIPFFPYFRTFILLVAEYLPVNLIFLLSSNTMIHSSSVVNTYNALNTTISLKIYMKVRAPLVSTCSKMILRLFFLKFSSYQHSKLQRSNQSPPTMFPIRFLCHVR